MDVHFEYHGNTFVWDKGKARSNLHKHGVAFEEAAAAFFDPLFVLVDASRHEESRDALIGFDAGSRLLYVVHVGIDAEVLRLVSAGDRWSVDEGKSGSVRVSTGGGGIYQK